MKKNIARISLIIFLALSMVTFFNFNKAKAAISLKDSNFATSIVNGGNFILTDHVEINESIVITKEVVLDLNNRSIIPSSSWNSDDAMFIIKDGGSLTIDNVTGSRGFISSNDVESIISVIKVIGDNETTSTKLVVKGGAITGTVYAISGDKDYDNTEITLCATNSSYKVQSTGANGAGVYHPQDGILNISGFVVGSTGVYMSDGKLNITFAGTYGGYIVGTGAKTTWQAPVNGIITSTGEGLVIDNSDNSMVASDFTMEGILYNKLAIASDNARAVGSYATDSSNVLKKFITSVDLGNESYPNDEQIDLDLIAEGWTLDDRYSGPAMNLNLAHSVVRIPNINGSGTEEDPWLIEDLEDLIEFRDANISGNYYTNQFVKLTSDIDMSSISNWEPIHTFSGTFDGSNHKISNFSINEEHSESGTQYYGLFGIISGEAVRENDNIIYRERAVVKNLHFVDVNVNITGTGSMWYGTVAASSEGEVINCTVTGSINTTSKYGTTGGVLGRAEGVVDNCKNEATVTGNSEIGGIAGNAYYGIEIINCENKGTIKGASQAGGIVGYAYDAKFENCVNNGEVQAEHTVGGIVGYATDEIIIKDCENNSDIVATSYEEQFIPSNTYFISSNAGGIAGMVSSYDVGEITNCTNNGNVDGQGLSVGGIAGINYYATIEQCTNNGDVTTAGKGAILACNPDDDPAYDYTAYAADGAGGVVGMNAGLINNSVNNGNVTGGTKLQVGIANKGQEGEDYFVFEGTPQPVTGIDNGIGGIVGVTSLTTFFGQEPTESITNSLNTGEVKIGDEVVTGSDICCADIALLNGVSSLDNNYYLSDVETADGGRTQEQFESGQVAYELSGGNQDSPWGQEIGGTNHELTPSLGSSHVSSSTNGSEVLYGNLYQITYLPTINGSFIVTTTGTELHEVIAGTLVIIATTPEIGYISVKFTVTAENGENIVVSVVDGTHVFEMPKQSVEVAVEFELEDFDVNIASNIRGEITTNLSKANYQNEIEVTVTPNFGYVLVEVSYSDGVNAHVLTVEDGKYKFVMPACDVTISAVFDQSLEIIDDIAIAIQELKDKTAELELALDTKVDKTVYEAKVAELEAAIENAKQLASDANDDLKEELTAAIAAAKQEAISASATALAAAKQELETAIATKADKVTFEAKVAELETAIDNLETSLKAFAQTEDDKLEQELIAAIAAAKAEAIEAAKGYIPYIGENGNWWIGQTDTGIAATGPKGDKGETGNGIYSITKLYSDGLVDTYKITFTDGTSSTFTIKNGADGAIGPQGSQGIQGVGIEKIEKTASDGNIDIYTITLTNGTSYTFAVTNGVNGQNGKDGLTPYIGENGNWWIGETDTGVKAKGVDGKDAVVVTSAVVSGAAVTSNIAVIIASVIKRRKRF